MVMFLVDSKMDIGDFLVGNKVDVNIIMHGYISCG